MCVFKSWLATPVTAWKPIEILTRIHFLKTGTKVSFCPQTEPEVRNLRIKSIVISFLPIFVYSPPKDVTAPRAMLSMHLPLVMLIFSMHKPKSAASGLGPPTPRPANPTIQPHLSRDLVHLFPLDFLIVWGSGSTTP